MSIAKSMTANEIRQKFFTYFADKKHKIVPSAPIVNKNDPSLLFTNAGMNQFKDYFLGNENPPQPRLADTQKCLRVSGKHNDLEEVGRDSYHHTMFEMLGNWSFGDYFKEEAIAWAWDLLVNHYKIEADRIYATVFEGDEKDGLAADDEAVGFWKKWLPEDRILYFDRKDNFWEMGDTGPCGPCSELHVDLRSEQERAATSGAQLVNKDNPLVIEIWNLVFIQYNRKADGSLVELPAKHIDTGMGFERLCMIIQGKQSSYDSDLFSHYISHIEEKSGIKYTGSYAEEAKSDIAMRVISDHLRAVSFTIADGALPSNTGAGYVIRRILRRAVRYYYSFLDLKEPFLHTMVPMLAETSREVFPELLAQVDFVSKVVREEEKSFLRTLESGLRRLDQIETIDETIAGEDAFELYDTYGFPIDLTRLLATERGWKIDEPGFEVALASQRKRSRADAQKSVGDWVELTDQESTFVGYDDLTIQESKVVKYRTVESKGNDQLQMVLSQTPFYAEGGGQVGDQGSLHFGAETIQVQDTVRENNLFIHLVDKLPEEIDGPVSAEVDAARRHRIENNHSATHLLHAALRSVLGEHVAQKGSLVNDKYLRFDFSHFQKMTEEEVQQVEMLVNAKIRQNIALGEDRSIPLAQAREAGAMMLFGEKYGEEVRMITFDPEYSRELCGGCHVSATGRLGYFKITTETAVAAGVRRIEAVTAEAAEAHLQEELLELKKIRGLFKNPQHATKQVSDLQEENRVLRKKLDKMASDKLQGSKQEMIDAVELVEGVNFLATSVNAPDSGAMKNLAYQLEKELGDAVIVFGAVINEKPQLMVTISEQLTKSKDLNAGNIVRELAKEIKGGGGGQPFFATAGGKDVAGLEVALGKARALIFDPS